MIALALAGVGLACATAWDLRSRTIPAWLAWGLYAPLIALAWRRDPRALSIASSVLLLLVMLALARFTRIATGDLICAGWLPLALGAWGFLAFGLACAAAGVAYRFMGARVEWHPFVPYLAGGFLVAALARWGWA